MAAAKVFGVTIAYFFDSVQAETSDMELLSSKCLPIAQAMRRIEEKDPAVYAALRGVIEALSDGKTKSVPKRQELAPE